MHPTTLHVCIPAMNERDYLPETLECLAHQDIRNFTVTICVNQPDSWHETAEKTSICENNAATLQFLREYREFPIRLIDRSTKGNGWNIREGGVGSARKVAMEAALKLAAPHDLLVSLDADTVILPGYLQSLSSNFQQHPNAVALAVPYYHRLTGDERADRAILRYEIYMRNYALNLFRIGCPYNFTALGSAIALRVSAYRAVGGMTPKKSGEDFYFLQKLRKYGQLLTYNTEKAYPAARFSDRVFFGTGPAMIKGDLGDWESYPIYNYKLFDRIKETYDSFKTLFQEDIETPVSPALREIFKEENLWGPLRENFHEPVKFIRACHEKLDALRILQVLKAEQKKLPESDEENLRQFLETFYPASPCRPSKQFKFSAATVADLNNIRDFLVEREEEVQKIGHHPPVK